MDEPHREWAKLTNVGYQQVVGVIAGDRAVVDCARPKIWSPVSQFASKNGALLFSLAVSVGIQGGLFVSGMILARELGPANRGNVALLTALPAVVSQVSVFGVPASIARYVSAFPNHWRSLVTEMRLTIGIQALVGSALLTCIEYVYILPRGRSLFAAASLAVIYVPIAVFQIYLLAILQGVSSPRTFNVARGLTSATYPIALAVAAVRGLTPTSALAAFLFGQGSATVITVVFVARLPSAITKDVPVRDVRRFGVIGFLAQVSPLESFRLDLLLVGALFSSVQTGYYSVALSLSNPPRFAADALCAVAYPEISRSDGGRRDRVWHYMRVGSLLCITAALPATLFGYWLVPLLFGKEFGPAREVTVVLALAAALFSIRRISLDCLRALGFAQLASVLEGAFLVCLGGASILAKGSGLMAFTLTLLVVCLCGLITSIGTMKWVTRSTVQRQVAST